MAPWFWSVGQVAVDQDSDQERTHELSLAQKNLSEDGADLRIMLVPLPPTFIFF